MSQLTIFFGKILGPLTCLLSEVAFVTIDKIIVQKPLYYSCVGKSTQNERTLLLRGCDGDGVGRMYTEEGKVKSLHRQGTWGSFRQRHGSKAFRGSSCWNLRIQGGKENFKKFGLGYDSNLSVF